MGENLKKKGKKMFDDSIYYLGDKYWYSFRFCVECKRFTTHKVSAPQGSGTFDVNMFKWKCQECKKRKKKK